jgi:hypothetical protein
VDHVRAAAGFLSLVLAASAIAAAPDLDAIHAARWLPPSADRARALGSIPTECLTPAGDPEAAYRIEVGRAAFKTPLLLGGQAGRAGLACDSCHESGRTNPDFFFPGVSGAPGTATRAALLSSHPSEGIDQPKPIPDLSAAKASLKVDQDPKSGALEPFVSGLVTDEFDGAAPPPAVIDGLAAYVRALSPAACPAEARQPLTPAVYVDNARRAVRVARQSLARDDRPTAVFLTEAARSQLGLIFERLDQPDADQARAALKAAALELAADAEAIRRGDPAAGDRLAAWIANSEGWARVVDRAAPGSLFDVSRLH